MLFNIVVGIIVGSCVGAALYFLNKKVSINPYFSTVTTMVIIVVVIKLSSMYLLPHYEAWQFESNMKKIPVFALIEKVHPVEYKIFLSKSKEAIISRKNNFYIEQLSTELLAKLLPKYLKSAPNEQLHRYLGSRIKLLEYLYTIDPNLVVRIEL